MATETRERIGQRIHRQAMAASRRELTGLLSDVLTPTLLAYVSGVDSVDAVKRWAAGQISEIGDRAVEERLRAAYEVINLLLIYDAPETIQAWFIGMNDVLDDAAPAEAVRNGRFDDALRAATAFVAYG